MSYLIFAVLLIVASILSFIAFSQSKKSGKKTNIVKFQYFGEVDLNNPDEYYEQLVKIGDIEVSLDLNFEETKVSTKSVEATLSWLENLDKLVEIANQKIAIDFKVGHLVKEYINHQHSVFDKVELTSIGVDVTQDSISQKEMMFNALYLKRIGIYPEDNERQFIFDYTVSNQLTDYILMVVFNCKGELVGMVEES
ncbi:DUF2004 domain-containing protein [Xanthovirga aplysinae]|uniref:DUF2004 domain-containing protein n=1 Tax=Xanthovirga aplysinae TaxID=2529853 RepID=UPI0012BC1916|nr:DUF2004 domain-containing protein [Xanthovirga aplysinae]MTI32524.1 DUF2004 domain-containing protein [Xanthovirga aplysinae]